MKHISKLIIVCTLFSLSTIVAFLYIIIMQNNMYKNTD